MAAQAILPSNPHDPTAQDRRERGAINDFDRRLAKVRALYIGLLGSIPYSVVTVNANVYQYQLSPEMLQMQLDDVGTQVDRILLEHDGRDLWFAGAYVEPAYQQGTAVQYSNLSVQSAGYAASRPTLDALLTSQPYRTRLGFLKARVSESLKGYAAAVRTHMGQVLSDGLAIGKGVRDIAAQLTKQIGIESRAAMRIARTEVPGALRSARLAEADQAGADLGILTKEMHFSALSPTTRPTHRARHAKLYTTQEQRLWWDQDGNRFNCYIPGTEVAGRFVAGSKAHYKGVVVEIVTADGTNLTVTPNHPVMTPFGLVAAAELREGDYLLAYRNQVEDSAGVTALDGEAVDTRIEHVLSSLADLGKSWQAGVRAVDFHGDARFMDEQIDVVWSERELARGLDAQLAQVLDQFALVHSDSVSSHVFGALSLDDVAVDLTASGILGGGSVEQALLPGHVGVATEGTGATVARGETGVFEPAHDYRTGDGEVFAELLDRYAGKVQLVQISHIRNREFSGHVYDLEEKSGLMVANGIIASNCKCSTITVLVDKDGKPLNPGVIARAQALLERNPAPEKA